MRLFWKVLPQYLAPQHLLSRLMGWMCNCHWVWLKNWMIRKFIRKYHVDMQAAQIEDPASYPTFNQFFIRKLKPGLRSIVSGANQIACPADGCISQIGDIKNTSLFQAKGFDFNLTELLGGNEQTTKPFINGKFATVYLSPRDYHRVHMPITGSLRETIYIPGDLFSVNQITAQVVPRLFARNERLVCIFDTEIGPMSVILVGAMLVASIHTIWDETPRHKTITRKTYNDIQIKRGEELGYFQLGSTVIVLFGENKMRWSSELQANTGVNMGQLFGEIRDS